MWSIIRANGSIIVGCVSLSSALSLVVEQLPADDQARVVIAGALFARRARRVRVLLDGVELATVHAPPACRRAA